jgi:hypothetical protein
MKHKQAKNIAHQLSEISKTDKEFFKRLTTYREYQREKETQIWLDEFVNRVMAEHYPNE